jgi:hypothetical protein
VSSKCPEWDGEGDEFNVRSLEGIEHCANIRELYLTHGCDGVSLRPLTGLRHLTKVFTDGACFTDCEALLDLPTSGTSGIWGSRLKRTWSNAFGKEESRSSTSSGRLRKSHAEPVRL